MHSSTKLHRRSMLKMSAASLAALGCSPALAALLEGEEKPRFKIAACDWSLGKRGDPGCFEVAKEIGLDGVQVSFGPPGETYDLRKEEIRQQYRAAAEQNGVEINSLAMGVLNSRPYASDPEAEQWVVDCVDTMPKLDQKVVLLAFFGNGDIKNNPEAQKSVIERLKKVAPTAEKNGVVLGIESWMDADSHLRILDAVGSPAVKVYYDVANMDHEGYDVYEGIRRLGRDRICEIHCKENGYLLGTGKVDFVKVRQAVDDIQWSGWLVLEGATIGGKSLVDCYKENRAYLEKVFLS